MAQYKKDEIKARIDAAALLVFARKGYRAAKISEIASQAEVSVGNIYRYYNNKDHIFYTIVPESFPSQFKKAITDKIGAAQNGLAGDTRSFRDVTDAIIGFMLAHRERITILFAGSKGTKYEHIQAAFAEEMISFVKSIFPEGYARYISRYRDDVVLLLIYENLIGMYGHVLRWTGKEKELIDQITQVNLYHFSGIMKLLDI